MDTNVLAITVHTLPTKIQSSTSMFLLDPVYLHLFIGGAIYVTCVFLTHSGVQHILCCALCLMVFVLCTFILPVSLDCPFFIALSIFSNVYLPVTVAVITDNHSLFKLTSIRTKYLYRKFI